MKDVARLTAIRKCSSATPTEENLVGIVSEIRRLNRAITARLERDLKRAGCLSLESYEVLHEIDESGKVHLTPAELQTRLAAPRHRVSRLIDTLAKDGYVELEKLPSDVRGHFVGITDTGRRALKSTSSVLSAAVRGFFYRKRRI